MLCNWICNSSDGLSQNVLQKSITFFGAINILYVCEIVCIHDRGIYRFCVKKVLLKIKMLLSVDFKILTRTQQMPLSFTEKSANISA